MMLYRCMFCITLHVGETDGPPGSGTPAAAATVAAADATAAADSAARVPDTDPNIVKLGLLLAGDTGMKSAFERFTAWLWPSTL